MFKHVPKHANAGAHLLVAEGLRREEETYLFNAIPPYAQEAMDKDCQHLGFSGRTSIEVSLTKNIRFGGFFVGK